MHVCVDMHLPMHMHVCVHMHLPMHMHVEASAFSFLAILVAE